MKARLLPIAALALLVGCAHAAKPALEPMPKDAVHLRVKTRDGWELELLRYRPKEPSRHRPVLLVHGISTSARNMDLDADHSLARWMAAHGRDAFALSLRATGRSDMPDAKAGRPPGFPFDVYWRQDVPAAIARIRELTGAAEVDYVGHSMGGMVLYAYLSQGGQGVGAGVVLGSPTRLDWGAIYDPLLVTVAGHLGASWTLPTHMASALAPLTPAMPGTPLEYVLYNPENTSLLTMRTLAATATADVSAGVARQLSRLVEDGFFGCDDRSCDFRADLRRVRTPVLVVAGKVDRLGVAPAVKDGYRLLGGPKQWLLMGVENGARADYGHMDLIIGDRAPIELWPRLLDFLDRHHSTAR